MVLQGKPANSDVSKPEEENTTLSKINSDSTGKDSSDVTISDIQMDMQILDTLDNTKNPTSDLNLDSNIFEAVAPVTDVDMSLPTSSMNIDDPALDTEDMSLVDAVDPHIEASGLSWNHNSLSINNESDCMNPLKADTNLNQMNTSESNTIHTPLSVPTDNKMITTSNDLSSLSEAITPSSLGIPLVSPVENIPKDTPLTDTPTLEMSEINKSPLQKPELTSPIESAQSSLKTLEPIKSPVPLPPLTSGYELPRICLLLDENKVPSLPPRPPVVPVTQLYPPTPSITVCFTNFFTIFHF